MADIDIQMTERNDANTDWDNLYPVTKAGNIKVQPIPGLAGEDAQVVLQNLFQFADNGKKDIASVVGAPATSGDTFSQLKDKIQTIKNTIAANLTAKGVTAAATEALSSLAGKIANIIRGSGKAQSSDVLKDKTFSNDDGPSVGTMPSNGPAAAETINLTSQNQEYTIAAGHHTGLRKIKAVISGLIASVIKAGTTVGGIVGTFTSDATATAAQILSGAKAYVNGVLVTGTMVDRGSPTVTPTKTVQNLSAGFYGGIVVNGVPSPVSSFQTGIGKLIDNTTNVTIPITPINISKSFIMLQHTEFGARTSIADCGRYRAIFKDNSNIQIFRNSIYQSGTAEREMVHWWVISFDFIKSVQSGTTSINYGNEVTISTVNPAKSLVICNHTTTEGGTNAQYARAGQHGFGYLSSPTKLTLVGGGGGPTNMVSWFVIEFDI